MFSTILLTSPLTAEYAFADKDDGEKKDKKEKTLESECAKKLDKKKPNLDGLFCQAIFDLQILVEEFNVDSFFDIFTEITVHNQDVEDLDIRITSLEENTENCQNEFLVKQTVDKEFTDTSGYHPSGTFVLENFYELSTNCESKVIPINITVNDVSTIGTYYTETSDWYDEETGESGEQLVYIAECSINFEGEFSEDATFYDYSTITSISVENDGTHQLTLQGYQGIQQSVISGIIPEEMGMSVLLFEKWDDVGISTPEELIGAFSIVGEFTITDIYGNTVSDTATYSCSP